MKRIAQCIVLIGWCSLAQSQISNSGTFYVESATDVIFLSDFSNLSGGSFTNDGNLYVENNWTNNATHNVGTGTTYFDNSII